MPNDFSIANLFDHAKKSIIQINDVQYDQPTVFATYVVHAPNSHPSDQVTTADLVRYANGPLTLSSDKKTLTGEMKLWHNQHTFGPDEDVFSNHNDWTVVIIVSDSGQAKYQLKLKGKPLAGFPPTQILAFYVGGKFVENPETSPLLSLSFSLGKVRHP